MKGVNSKPVFLTGATGFIGSHVAEFFCKKGVEVICGVREESKLDHLRSLPVSIRFINLLDRDSLARAVRKAGFVVHTAGLVNDWSSFRDFHETNVVGTRNLLHAALEAGITGMVSTGSSASYGEEDSAEVKSEDSPDRPRYPYFLDKIIPCRLNYYRITKHTATLEAMAFARRHHLDLTVIEPVWVYGEREFSSGFYEYMKVVGSGLPFFPGSDKNHFHVIYAGDLARAYYLAYVKRPPGICRILAGNRQTDRMADIYSLFCREMGVKKPVNLPKALVYPMGLIMELTAGLFRTSGPPLLSRGRVNMMYDNIQYSCNRAEKVLGFTAEMPLREGIARTVAWYRENNLIKTKP